MQLPNQPELMNFQHFFRECLDHLLKQEEVEIQMPQKHIRGLDFDVLRLVQELSHSALEQVKSNLWNCLQKFDEKELCLKTIRDVSEAAVSQQQSVKSDAKNKILLGRISNEFSDSGFVGLLFQDYSGASLCEVNKFVLVALLIIHFSYTCHGYGC